MVQYAHGSQRSLREEPNNTRQGRPAQQIPIETGSKLENFGNVKGLQDVL